MLIRGFGNGKKLTSGRYVYDPKLRKLVRFIPPPRPKVPTVIGDIKEFVTDHISGKPINIHGRRQKREVMRQHGVREYDTGMVDKRDTYAKETTKMVNKLKEENRWFADSKKGWDVAGSDDMARAFNG